jgi:hypothetical protein
MWFEKRSKHVSETEKEPLEHWPTERMVLAGHADYAMREDLADLPDADLIKVANICTLSEFAPEECIPCYAHTMYLDRQKARLEEMDPDIPDDEVYDENGEFRETPKLNELVNETMSFIEPDVKPEPVADRFAAKVEELNDLVREMLSGPPIPPKDVSVTDLALLVVGAERWVKMTEAQGVELSDNQQQVLDSTKALVARLRS